LIGMDISKARIARMLGRGARGPLFWRATRKVFLKHASIVYYHGVWPKEADAQRMFGGVTLDQFESDLRLIREQFDVVSLADMLIDRPGFLGERPRLVVTFDDGFDLTRGGATDVLAHYGVPATVFVNSASASYHDLMWQHKLGVIRATRGDDTFVRELNAVLVKTGIPTIAQASHQGAATRLWPASRKDDYVEAVWRGCSMPPAQQILRDYRPYFDWDGLRHWIGRGHSVGFHTHSHPFCSGLQAAEVERELIEPVKQLRSELGIATVAFAYPFGDRLPPGLEADVMRRNVFSCLLGTGRLSARYEDAATLDRVDAEAGLDAELYGWPLVRRFKRLLFRSTRGNTTAELRRV
jgi:peptidoglycan/xylan/chitin deacetylase (PgdA/CDA1 family)